MSTTIFFHDMSGSTGNVYKYHELSLKIYNDYVKNKNHIIVGWDNNLSNEVSYALCVSFETIEGEKEIYELMERAQIQIEQEQELEV